jgi:uncharacterized protein (UPF0332 family)
MLDDLERKGYIKRLPVDKRKVKDSLQLAKRDITVAKGMLGENDDWAFSIAYNAILQAVRALMFSQGYRPSGGYQHIAVVRFAEYFLKEEDVIVFDRMRRKRHTTLYDTAGTVLNRRPRTR